MLECRIEALDVPYGKPLLLFKFVRWWPRYHHVRGVGSVISAILIAISADSRSITRNCVIGSGENLLGCTERSVDTKNG
jgi:hypothetical protein